ncbi:hypothetical protein D1222_14000 [Henriciella algicola]|uniref:Uncharacterized protein n=2 Tax=Henriciella algicola TaxID=1608422 RepID=A0A399RC50_9PROT|nr:hypothetical protein D1222_14000 [Henriciella algicola]
MAGWGHAAFDRHSEVALMWRELACVLALAAMTGGPVSAQDAVKGESEPVQVMVLGVYHFDNPGLDVNNIETDNILSPNRQEELQVLGEALASFEPTAIALEIVSQPPYLDAGFQSFEADDLLNEASEDVQIGYRVARIAGVDRVYAINEQPSGDEPDYFPFDRVSAFAERAGRQQEFTALADMSDMVSQFEALQATSTIPELLKLHNSDWVPDHFYWEIIGYGEGEEQPGAELAAYWFMRNAKIFNKLQQVTEPGDRVLVVYGSGHKAWLDELVEKTPGYQSVDPLPYLDLASTTLEGR